MCAGGSSCSAGVKPTSVAQSQTASGDEQQISAGASESANLVQAPEQPSPQQQQQQQPEQQQEQQQQQNEVHEEYLPPHTAH